jgi:hypothetical protein
MSARKIQMKILEAEPNRRGDLFGRLMEDLFASLGYEQFRLNIHKSGREVDLQARHRTEPRRLVAECKATGEPIGGSDLNKFYGVVDVEKRKLQSGLEMAAYFVSLSGFTETAVEQELDAGNLRFVRLNGEDVASELVTGRIIVPQAKAIELAGRCCAGQGDELASEETADLLAHELGWIWAVYFGKQKERTSFALIYADGEALPHKLAQSVIRDDKAAGGELHTLSLITPLGKSPVPEQEVERAKDAYAAYVGRECGEIQLEGLPADQDVGSRRLKLENIFVPLHLAPSRSIDRPTSLSQADPEKSRKKPKAPSPKMDRKRLSIGRVLSRFHRIVVLGLPGGGKSTLLKRIAVAYAFPQRRKLIHDQLPDKDWIPLFIRCRQLDKLVRSPITEIISDLRKRAELTDDLDRPFRSLISDGLHRGNALLLVDGLDEISDEGDRVAFVQQLRVFLATYPGVGVVITCREAGFRVIGGALADQCTQLSLADLSDSEITELTVAWHKEVVGQKPEVVADAQRLAQTICKTDRVRRLAQNPLLLTTLLLVKRWVGQLPTRRSVLYGKAVEVLLMTWNVEGHDPIDPDEALPQLEFVAFQMTRERTQTISLRKLKEILSSARAQMPEILGYTKISVQEFIERVELRSSLLMLSGFEVEAGTLYPTYEFRHLTFQEYLTARSIVEGHYPNRKDSDTLLTLLGHHIAEQNWQEVVLLAAVLAGRKAQPLIQLLTEQAQKFAPEVRDVSQKQMTPPGLLAQCITDEVQLSPGVLEEAMKWIAHRDDRTGLAGKIYTSKYADVFKEVCLRELRTSEADLLSIGGLVSEYMLASLDWPTELEKLREPIDRLFATEDPNEKATACLASMDIGWSFFPQTDQPKENSQSVASILRSWLGKVIALVPSEDRHLAFSAMWAVVWLGKALKWNPTDHPQLFGDLLTAWQRWSQPEIRYIAAWAITSIPVINRDLRPYGSPGVKTLEFISSKEHGRTEDDLDDMISDAESNAALTVAFYAGAPWNDEQLASRIGSHGGPGSDENALQMLKEMGEIGERRIAELEARETNLAVRNIQPPPSS